MLAAAWQGVHRPTAETDGVSVDAPGGFVVGHQDAQDGLSLIEMVRPPETVENWSQMISVATLMNFSQRSSLKQFYSLWRENYRATCPGPGETLVRGTVDNRPALKATFHCPRDLKTGKPESLTLIYIQGEVNLFSIHLAFRRPMTALDSRLVQSVLKSIKVCDSRDRAACSKRRATGFLPVG